MIELYLKIIGVYLLIGYVFVVYYLNANKRHSLENSMVFKAMFIWLRYPLILIIFLTNTTIRHFFCGILISSRVDGTE